MPHETRPATALINTVGTSLLGNVARLRAKEPQHPLAIAVEARAPTALAAALKQLQPTDRDAGAEINSIASMLDQGKVTPTASVFFCHSDTDDGRLIGHALAELFRLRGHPQSEAILTEDLQDEDPPRFARQGLRHLAREVCKIVRDFGPSACAINATGGYKAQIAIAVLLGQALSVPVYYKHERFNAIIAFPPMPVGLDLQLWLELSGPLFLLDAAARRGQTLELAQIAQDWDERAEAMIDRIDIDGTTYVELSPTGLIFHEGFAQRFEQMAPSLLPPPAQPKDKRPAQVANKETNVPQAARDFMQKVIDEVPQVIGCVSWYHNPDLSRSDRFSLGAKGIEGRHSNGTWCVKFEVQTTAQTPEQRRAMVAQLNRWLNQR